MSTLLAGKVVALIGTGEADRGMVMACAEAGAKVALGTATREAEFALASVANEAWALGAEQFLNVMDGTDAAAVTAFAAEVYDRFGTCDGLILAYHKEFEAAFEELSLEEWEDALRVNLTGPFLAAQAFSRLMDREDSGTILFVAPAPAATGSSAKVTGLAGPMGVRGLASSLADLAPRGVRVGVIEAEDAAAVVAALSG